MQVLRAIYWLLPTFLNYHPNIVHGLPNSICQRENFSARIGDSNLDDFETNIHDDP